MKKLILTMMILFSGINYADDYKTAQRFQEGDTISAAVLNDILDRIELTLKSITPAEMVGTWDVTWKTCVNGGPGNCSSLNVGTGWGSAIDGLYKARTDTWVISDDGDDTYSVSMDKCYSGAVAGAYYNDSCVSRLAVDSGILLLGTISGDGVSLDADHSDTYNIKRESGSRYTVWKLASGSGSFVSFTLDKKNLSPESPTGLAISLSAGTAALTWTAGDATETGYDVQRKASSDGTYASIGTPTAESYNDSTIAKGNSYWYRVFATNANGTSVGSNVIQITYSNTPPSMNLSSTISVNEGTTSVVTVGATDADGDSLTYTISNPNASTDAEDLSVSSEGVITFNASPDWEIPTDYNTNNIYDIRVSVSDGTDTVSQDISVVVLDVDGS